jgi:hypothetical protein
MGNIIAIGSAENDIPAHMEIGFVGQKDANAAIAKIG